MMSHTNYGRVLVPQLLLELSLILTNFHFHFLLKLNTRLT